MNRDQIKSVIRAMLLSGGPLGAWIIAHGWASSDEVSAFAMILQWLVGVLPPVAGLWWGVADHTDAAKIASVESMPAVKSIAISVPLASSDVNAVVADRSRPKVVAAPRGE